MLTTTERITLKGELESFGNLSYGQIAARLTERFGRKISRNTVRYYLGSMSQHKGRTKGRPRVSTPERDIWGQLLPELLALTGLSASRLYRMLTHLLEPAGMPFGKSVFHERMGSLPSVKGAAQKKRSTPFELCNLRIKVVTVSQDATRGMRVYLFGYEEFTGYTVFDRIPPTPPSARRIANFAKAVEKHLGLPVRRLCLVGKEFEKLAATKSFEQVDLQYVDKPNVSSQLISPYTRRAEIDLLRRITKKQNDEVARAKTAVAKEAISDFIQRARLRDSVWESPAQRKVTQRLQEEAAELELFLKMRFKLYAPKRRPT